MILVSRVIVSLMRIYPTAGEEGKANGNDTCTRWVRERIFVIRSSLLLLTMRDIDPGDKLRATRVV
jgi:hypothetical protein